ncbi:FecR family protein [Variovorax sp.]|jgi:transmembrane sensor|uniref:FecR family protein n=3 Tax=Variovorax sp. TaxID=1871043 RepID=UPI0037DA060F
MISNMADDDSEVLASRLDEEARAWVRRLRSGAATRKDARQLAQWRARGPGHAQAFERAKREWQAIGGVAQAHQRLFPEAAAAPGRAAVQAAVAVDTRRRWLLGAGFASAGAAAIAAVVHPPLALWPSWSELVADYRTGTGQQATVTLAADVELMLNTQTSLAVQPGAAAGGGERIRLIAGEATLRRGPGAPFVELVAGDLRIVPGVGNVAVWRQDERYRVSCIEGRVEVMHPTRTVALREGEQIWCGATGVSPVAQVDMAQTQAWRRGELVFRATPLSEAVDEINRYRNGRVVLASDSLARHRLSGHFRINALDEAIEQIEVLFGARATRWPGGIVMLG